MTKEYSALKMMTLIPLAAILILSVMFAALMAILREAVDRAIFVIQKFSKMVRNCLRRN
jgi:hypothetical protein